MVITDSSFTPKFIVIADGHVNPVILRRNALVYYFSDSTLTVIDTLEEGNLKSIPCSSNSIVIHDVHSRNGHSIVYLFDQVVVTITYAGGTTCWFPSVGYWWLD